MFYPIDLVSFKVPQLSIIIQTVIYVSLHVP